MKRIIVILTLILLGQVSLAQRVLYSSKDISLPYNGPAIRVIHFPWYFSTNITIKYSDGHKQDVPLDSIWGMENRKGQLFRYYKGSFFRILNSEGVIRYGVLRPGGRGVANYSYFSHDMDSPLRWTKAKARRDTLELN